MTSQSIHLMRFTGKVLQTDGLWSGYWICTECSLKRFYIQFSEVRGVNTPDLAILFLAMDRWIGTGFVSLRCGEKAAGGLTEIFRVAVSLKSTRYAAAKAMGYVRLQTSWRQ
jgi:hypothetical protein